ncbi:MAG: hypothetical protein H7A25_19445 [Leptospiraceae bacterium]|nr:hypothetical protein [Leptospiraceae bacterium]MCP5502083.1 hypothetical protein [Leptospiraceae bacterium]
MKLLSFSIVQLTEFVFLLSILINLLSYVIGFFIILHKKHLKTFFRTLKEGWSAKYITGNIAALSALITSLTVFWFLLVFSANLKKLSIQKAIIKNPYLSSYFLLALLLLLIYTLIISIKNIRKARELCSDMLVLSYWASSDKFFDELGKGFLSPFTALSSIFRKSVIQSQMSQLILSSFIWMIGEYVFKISIVVSVFILGA